MRKKALLASESDIDEDCDTDSDILTNGIEHCHTDIDQAMKHILDEEGKIKLL